MGVGGAPRAVGGRVAGSPLREAVGIHPAIAHYARSLPIADSEFGFRLRQLNSAAAEFGSAHTPRITGCRKGRARFGGWNS